MKKRIEVRTQAEFDVCVKAGNIAVCVGGGFFVAWGSSHVVARGSSHVVAWESSHVEAWESSHVEAWGSSHVEARGSSHVVAWGNVFVRLFSALSIKASTHVAIMVHGDAQSIEGGQQMTAMKPNTGADWCEYFGIDPTKSDLVVPNIDAAILASLAAHANTNGLDMGSWHGESCDETNWCNTTHCRAGYAICLAGKAGFELERKVGPEVAGQMIYAASRPDKPLPDFHTNTETALADIRACAGGAP